MNYFNLRLESVLNESFLNIKDLQDQLNKAINPHLEKAGIMWGDTPLWNVLTVDNETDGSGYTTGKHVFELYIGRDPKKDSKKIMDIANYFIGEAGVKHSDWQKTYHNNILSSTIDSFEKYDDDIEEQIEKTTEKTGKPPEEIRPILMNMWKRIYEDGKSVNVRDIGFELENGLFQLNRFIEDVDYVDLDTMSSIWSIGLNKVTGEILAAADGRFYNPNDPDADYETLYLR